MKSFPTALKILCLVLLAGLAVTFSVYKLRSNETESVEKSTAAATVAAPSAKPEFVRGIHLTSWVAGSKKARERIGKLFDQTELNTVVIAIKEYEGEVYIPGVPMAEKYKTYINAIPDVEQYLAQLKKKGVYTIARIVVFKDKKMPKARPDMAVKRPDGSVWTDRRGNTWTDPYNKDVWEYNFSVASRAIALGFDEIQFDYIRYPSDGDTKQCRYSYANHNSSSSARNLDAFLQAASKRLKPMGTRISIDVFGLTPSVNHDMGIGQKIVEMTDSVDYVSPMVYPSHYAKGEYGIPDPNTQPYRVVHKTMYDAKKRLGDNASRLRPYLQDFSLGHRYGAPEVRAQIQACEDLGIKEWLLWNPNCRYTAGALRTKDGKLPQTAHIPKAWTEWKGKNANEKSPPEPSVSSGTAPAKSEKSK